MSSTTKLEPVRRATPTPEPESDLGVDAFAPFWEEYNRLADAFEEWRIEYWKDALGTMVLYLGLFSAIVTAFIIRLHEVADPSNPAFEDPENPAFRNPTAPNQIPEIHWTLSVAFIFWLISLVLNLVAFITIVGVKPWVYTVGTPMQLSGSPLEQARIRQRRYRENDRSAIQPVIQGLYIFLNFAFAFFVIGLGFFMAEATGLFNIVTIVFAAVLYIGASIGQAIAFPFGRWVRNVHRQVRGWRRVRDLVTVQSSVSEMRELEVGALAWVLHNPASSVTRRRAMDTLKSMLRSKEYRELGTDRYGFPSAEVRDVVIGTIYQAGDPKLSVWETLHGAMEAICELDIAVLQTILSPDLLIQALRLVRSRDDETKWDQEWCEQAMQSLGVVLCRGLSSEPRFAQTIYTAMVRADMLPRQEKPNRPALNLFWSPAMCEEVVRGTQGLLHEQNGFETWVNYIRQPDRFAVLHLRCPNSQSAATLQQSLIGGVTARSATWTSLGLQKRKTNEKFGRREEVELVETNSSVV